MTRDTSFNILTLVKSGCFFLFLKYYLDLITWIISPSTLNLLLLDNSIYFFSFILILSFN
jgi:hypothetical protein